MEEDQAPLLASPPPSPTRLSHDWARIQLPRARQKRVLSRRRICLYISLAVFCIITLGFLYHGLAINPSPGKAEDLRWIATSESALDRFACQWLSICGALNWWYYSEPSSFGKPEDLAGPAPDFSDAWIDHELGSNPEGSWSSREREKRLIPEYVLEYAPYVFLHEEERYWPSDAAEHLFHSTVRLGGDREVPWNLSLTTLGGLNDLSNGQDGHNVYLTSNEDPETRPEWMLTRRNRPGYNNTADSDYSHAPVVLICEQKPEDILDAYYFFFYSFNEGNTVFGTRYGNHVGDWEHTIVRFQHGEPQALYLSRHSWGSAYTYSAIEKIGKRPVVFAGNGSHAHYPTAGDQPYVLPFGILKDDTGRGVQWDPIRNFYAYTYEASAARGGRGNGTFRAATLNPRAPTSWLHFSGHWGDQRYPLDDSRQYRFFGETHFSSGPTGPRDKRLEREGVCDTGKCRVEDHI
jgi:Vacuolar protein sorting-associated protein 62